MSHGNARTVFHGRLLIVQRHQAGWPQAHIAKAMGISRKCVKTWLDRYAAEGEAGLRDRSSRPHPLRRGPVPRSRPGSSSCVGGSVAGRPGSAPSSACRPRTVSRILVRHAMPPLAVLDPITGQVIRASKATAVRYERARPGELVHMDVKKIGRIPDGGGWRAHGRGAGSIRRDRSTKVGFDYVHSLVDDHSRLAYSEVLADEKGPTCAGFLARAIDLLRHLRHHPDRRADDRQRLGLQVRPCGACAPTSASVRSSSSPTAPGRTARSNGSTGPCRPSGPTGSSSPATPSEPPPLHPGSSTTTLNAATAHSEDSHPSAACYQPDGRVHLVRSASIRRLSRRGWQGASQSYPRVLWQFYCSTCPRFRRAREEGRGREPRAAIPVAGDP